MRAPGADVLGVEPRYYESIQVISPGGETTLRPLALGEEILPTAPVLWHRVFPDMVTITYCILLLGPPFLALLNVHSMHKLLYMAFQSGQKWIPKNQDETEEILVVQNNWGCNNNKKTRVGVPVNVTPKPDPQPWYTYTRTRLHTVFGSQVPVTFRIRLRQEEAPMENAINHRASCHFSRDFSLALFASWCLDLPWTKATYLIH